MLELLERQARLTGNQKKIVAAAVIGDMLDYFDFGLIGFALAFIIGPWHLTYGQSAMILLSSGIGGVPGALFYGWLADRIGRRTVFIATALNFSIATGIMALTPDQGGWIFLSVCRFFCRIWRRRPVYGRSAARPGVRGHQAPRFCRRTCDLASADQRHHGCGTERVRNSPYRLAWTVRDRFATGCGHAVNSRLGSRIAAVAYPNGPRRRGASFARLGARDRSKRNRAADEHSRSATNKLARALSPPAQHGVVGLDEFATSRVVSGSACGDHPSRPDPQDQAGRSRVSDDLSRSRRPDRAFPVLLSVRRDRTTPIGGLAQLRCGPIAGPCRLFPRGFHRHGFGLLSDALRPAGVWRWRLRRRRALCGRGLAVAPARERHGFWLWHR